MTDTLIKVENVSKKFCRSLKKSLWYGMQDIGNELLGRSHGGNGELRRDEFWAVKDVSFELRRGECLGLIGHNGAGKTTLLRMLNGLIKPDTGRIEIRGRVGALIALGAGFNPILTGRENVNVAGAVLGLTNQEINAKYDAIVEFAELGEFMNAPVQSYSSGMQVRLGFSIAAQLEPDILILDEVLAVGDIKFQVKCINMIRELQRKGVAIVLVSHNMTNILRYADVGMYLNKASVKKFGAISDVVPMYMQDQQPLTPNSEPADPLDNMGIRLGKIFVMDEDSEVLKNIDPFQRIFIHVPYMLERRLDDCEVLLGLGINDREGVFYQAVSDAIGFRGGEKGDSGEFVASIDGLRAAAGSLVVGVSVWLGGRGDLIGWSRENKIVIDSNSGNSGRVELKPNWVQQLPCIEAANLS